MKIFIRKILSYSILAVLICLAVVYTCNIINGRISYNVSKTKNILIVGDSQTECAIDDNILLRSINVSSSATSYLYSFAKIKAFLHANPHIDTVILSFHCGCLDTSLDNMWVYNSSLINSRIPTFLPYLDVEDLFIFRYYVKFYQSLLKIPKLTTVVFFRSLGSHKVNYKLLDIGSYKELHRNKLSEDMLRRSKNPIIHSGKFSDIETCYLKKIVKLCYDSKVKLILFSAPTYHVDRYFDTNAFNRYYTSNLAQTVFLNYSTLVLPDSAFGDVLHLNSSGSSIFSHKLQESLNIK